MISGSVCHFNDFYLRGGEFYIWSMSSYLRGVGLEVRNLFSKGYDLKGGIRDKSGKIFCEMRKLEHKIYRFYYGNGKRELIAGVV